MKISKSLGFLLYLSLATSSQPAFSQEVYHTLEEKKTAGLAEEIGRRLTMGGLIEVEAGIINDDYKEDGSDVVLATVEVGLDMKLNQFVDGHVLLLYEDDDTEEFTVDEGIVTITGPYGEFLAAGKMYIPFGVFNSHFISDPQTLELGETNESVVMTGMGNDRFSISIGAFNGDMHEKGDDDKVDDYFAAVEVTPVEGISFGASWLSDIADTDADIAVSFYNITTNDLGISDTVAGYSAYISLSFGPVTLDAEYLAAADEFEQTDLDADGDNRGDKPVTFNVELAFDVGKSMEIALKYEGNREFFELPEKQYGLALAYGVYDNTYIALEYLKGEYDKDYVPVAGDNEVSSVTAQLAIEF